MAWVSLLTVILHCVAEHLLNLISDLQRRSASTEQVQCLKPSADSSVINMTIASGDASTVQDDAKLRIQHDLVQWHII